MHDSETKCARIKSSDEDPNKTGKKISVVKEVYSQSDII